jgi:hypothetical protein
MWGAATAALVFAPHPPRVELVAWITERRETLSGLFSLTAVLASPRGVDPESRIARRWLASLPLFADGLLSKASLIVLPLVLMLLDVYPLRRGALATRPLIVEKAGYWALGAAGAGGALFALRLSGLRITGYAAYDSEAPGAMVALWEQGQTYAAATHVERAAAVGPGDPGTNRILERFRADPAHPPSLR